MKELVNIREGADRGAEPRWLENVRDEARRRFEEHGYPTTRTEEWRHTNITGLVGTAFDAPSPSLTVTAEQIAYYETCPVAGTRIVFVNGRFAPEFTQLDRLPRGVRVQSLAEAVQSDPDALSRWLGALSPSERHPFAALNATAFEDGAFVRIGREAVAEDPIVILHFSTAPDGPTVASPRHLIVAEEGSVASIIEVYAGIEGEAYFTNAVTEVRVAPGAALDHYKIQHESTKAYHIGGMAVDVADHAVFSSHVVNLGGKLTRNDAVTRLSGQHAEATLNGLSIVGEGRHVDNHTLIDHAVPNCNSHETYHGILDGRSRNVFRGRIIVRQDAQKTDAKQSNRNLLLTTDAVVDTIPQLEIFADDVKCTHGATVGALDDNAVFYLRARGIPEMAARGLLTYAFANEILRGIRVEGLRTRLKDLLLDRFTDGEERE